LDSSFSSSRHSCGCRFAFAPQAQAQQTLGGITGTVTDKTGSVLPDTVVTILSDQTKLTRTQKSNAHGSYDFVNLPIGSYTLTFTHDGFEGEKIPSITVQADRTATVNVALKIGQVGTVVTVEATPLMNAVDTTNVTFWRKTRLNLSRSRPGVSRPGNPLAGGKCGVAKR